MNVLLIALDYGPVDVDGAEVLVVAPALNSRLRRWTSDEDGARRKASARAEAFVERLRSHGVHAEGRVGDGDPVQAIADTLATFPADEIVVVAHPERSHRLADDLAARASGRYGLPILRSEELPRAA